MDPVLTALVARAGSPTATESDRRAAGLTLAASASIVVPALLAAMNEVDWPGWCRSVEVFGLFDPPPQVELLAGLRSSNSLVRKAAAAVLSDVRLGTNEVALALAKALNDPDRMVRQHAGWSLSRCKSVPQEAQHLLTAALSRASDANDRFHVVDTIRRIGPGAIPGLRASLRSPDGSVRHGALLALVQFEAWSDAVADLVACLDDGSARVRRDALRALGRMGAAARPALPALIAATRDSCQSGRRLAIDSLRVIGDLPPAAVPALVDRLGDPIANVRRRAADTLGDMGERGADAIGPLASALHDPNGTVVIAALDALGRLGPIAAPAGPALREFAGQSGQKWRRRVSSVLARIVGPTVREPR